MHRAHGRGARGRMPGAWEAVLSPSEPTAAAEPQSQLPPSRPAQQRNRGRLGTAESLPDSAASSLSDFPREHGSDAGSLSERVPEPTAAQPTQHAIPTESSSPPTQAKDPSTADDRGHPGPPARRPAPPKPQPPPKKLGFGSSAPRGLSSDGAADGSKPALNDERASKPTVSSTTEPEDEAAVDEPADAPESEAVPGRGNPDPTRHSQPALGLGQGPKPRQGRRLPPSLSKWKSRRQREEAAAENFAASPAGGRPAAASVRGSSKGQRGLGNDSNDVRKASSKSPVASLGESTRRVTFGPGVKAGSDAASDRSGGVAAGSAAGRSVAPVADR